MLTECIIMATAGVIMIVVGIISVMKDAFYLPWFTRSGVCDEFLNKYANGMGIGSVLIGSGVAVTAVCRIFWQHEAVWIIAAVGCAAGVIVIFVTYLVYARRR